MHYLSVCSRYPLTNVSTHEAEVTISFGVIHQAEEITGLTVVETPEGLLAKRADPFQCRRLLVSLETPDLGVNQNAGERELIDTPQEIVSPETETPMEIEAPTDGEEP